jgi:hypothetical protein
MFLKYPKFLAFSITLIIPLQYAYSNNLIVTCLEDVDYMQ